MWYSIMQIFFKFFQVFKHTTNEVEFQVTCT